MLYTQNRNVTLVFFICSLLEFSLSAVSRPRLTLLVFLLSVWFTVSTRWWRTTRICPTTTSAPGNWAKLSAPRLKRYYGANGTEHSWSERAANRAVTPAVSCTFYIHYTISHNFYFPSHIQERVQNKTDRQRRQWRYKKKTFCDIINARKERLYRAKQ